MTSRVYFTKFWIAIFTITYFLYSDNQGAGAADNSGKEVPTEGPACATAPTMEVDEAGSPAPAKTPPPAEEDCQEIIIVNEHTRELDLNHGRIGKIENLEPLKNLER